ncbi:MAG: metalloregulator ArsR/SmtB family transcription factor [Candidatus Diapherotrites archaeon]|nr:metalloregulator ArsR/SmtB family transcription factor [Candidatus Diapherotrites archaeon]
MQLTEYTRFLKTLSNPKSLKIILLLRNGSKSVTEIYRELKFNQSTTSRHLNCLQCCGFVFVKVQAQKRIYSLNRKTIQPLMNLIEQHNRKYCNGVCNCHA